MRQHVYQDHGVQGEPRRMITSTPLCLDLDGTLLNSDLLLEAAFA